MVYQESNNSYGILDQLESDPSINGRNEKAARIKTNSGLIKAKHYSFRPLKGTPNRVELATLPNKDPDPENYREPNYSIPLNSALGLRKSTGNIDSAYLISKVSQSPPKYN